jgi:hypothetical protein
VLYITLCTIQRTAIKYILNCTELARTRQNFSFSLSNRSGFVTPFLLTFSAPSSINDEGRTFCPDVTVSLLRYETSLTMPIEPLQLEPDLPESENENDNDNEVMVKPARWITAPSKLAKNRFLIFCAIVSAIVGLSHVLGFSSGGSVSNHRKHKSKNNQFNDEVFMDQDESSYFPGDEIESFLCDLAEQIPTDGIINLGQIPTTPSMDKILDHVPACFENADHLRSWYSSWYWIRRPTNGLFTANFNEVFTPANNTSAFDIHVSAYEGDCGEMLACVGTQGVEAGRHGSTTWTTVKGKTYVLRVQHMPGTKFEVPVVTGDSRE